MPGGFRDRVRRVPLVGSLLRWGYGWLRMPFKVNRILDEVAALRWSVAPGAHPPAISASPAPAPSAPPSATRDAVRRRMDESYRQGNPYQLTRPWDTARHEHLIRGVQQLGRDIDFSQSTVLEFGCAMGGFAANYVQAKRIVAVDISEEAIRKARESYPHVEFHACDAESFGGVEADVVFLVEVVEHFYDPDKAMAAVARCTKPGGCLILTTPNRDSLHLRINRLFGHADFTCNPEHLREYTLGGLAQLLNRHGFEIEETRGLFLLPYWGIPEFEAASSVRHMTDHNPTVIEWLRDLGDHVPPEYAFCIMLRAKRVR